MGGKKVDWLPRIYTVVGYTFVDMSTASKVKKYTEIIQAAA